MDAAPDWFSPEAPPATPESAEAAAPANDIPATLDLSVLPVDKSEQEKAAQSPFPDSVSLPEKSHLEATADAAPAASGDASSPGSFVVVKEEELGDVDEDEVRPPMFSWQTGRSSPRCWQSASAPAVPTAAAGRRPLQSDHGQDCRRIDRIAPRSRGRHPRLYSPALERSPARRSCGRYERELDLDNLQRKFESPIKRLTSMDDLRPIERAYSEAMNLRPPGSGDRRGETPGDRRFVPAAGSRRGVERTLPDSGPAALAQLRDEVKKRSAAQLSLIEKRLNAADDLRKIDPEQAGAMYRAVVELYGDKPWAADAVRRPAWPLST